MKFISIIVLICFIFTGIPIRGYAGAGGFDNLRKPSAMKDGGAGRILGDLKDERMLILQQLSKKNSSKIFFLVIDGLGGLPIDGKTELEAANHPELDKLTKKSAVGLVNITDILGIIPGSGPGHFSIFGYNPYMSLGRGVLDAFGADIEVKEGDIVARGNFATLENGLLIDRRAGRISTEKAQAIVKQCLSGIEIEGIKFIFYSTKEHRLALIARGEGLSLPITDSDPGKEGMAPLEVRAQFQAAERLAGLMNKLNQEINRRLANNPIEPKANTVIFRGFDTLQKIPSLKELYKLDAFASCTYPAYRGIAQAIGMEILPLAGTAISDQVRTVKENIQRGDLFYIHIKATDKYGEDGNFADKVKVIEEVDKFIPEIIKMMDLEKGDTLVVTGDHSTPAKMKSHSWHSLPALIYSKDSFESKQVIRFTEEEVKKGSLGVITGRDVMSLALAHAGKLDKIDGPIKTLDGGEKEVLGLLNFLSANSRFFKAVGGQTALRNYLKKIWEWYKEFRAPVSDTKFVFIVHTSFFRTGGAIDALKEIIQFKIDEKGSLIKLGIYGEGADKLRALFGGDNSDVVSANTVDRLIPELNKWRINPEEDIVVLRPIKEKIDLKVKQAGFSEKTISTVAVARAMEVLLGTRNIEEASKGSYNKVLRNALLDFYNDMEYQGFISPETYKKITSQIFLGFDLPDMEPVRGILEATKGEADLISKFIDSFI